MTAGAQSMLRLLSLAVALAAAAAAFPSFAQPVTLERDSPLYAEPRLESAPVAQLRRGSAGEVIGKDGGWVNLKTASGTGWLFSFNVRYPSERAPGDGSPRAGARRSTSVASGIGVRGLDEEDLRQATFDAGQLKRLDDYATSKEAAEQGARAAGLAPAKVDYLGSRP